MLVEVLIGVAVAVVAAWALLIVALLVARPKGVSLVDGLRLLPDLLRLLRGLAAERSLPWTVRARVWLALAWVINPLDLVPEFLPVIGLVDEIIVVTVLLRSVIRRAGPEVLQRHWPGTPQGLAVLSRLCGLPATTESSR
ncbi:MAG: DUF1232 domain-containing protein [Streptosporangiales bacterium]|nr:DUF1232 domain-containing protein [Streptosporangiales bacterium]